MTTYVPKAMRHDPWWHLVGLVSGLLFALLVMLARLYPEILNSIDQTVEAVVIPIQTFTTIEFFLTITTLGSIIGITLIALTAAYFLRNNRFVLVQLFLLLLFSSVSMSVAKLFVERVRPEIVFWLDPLNTYSFPSGHATLSTALYGFLAVCLYRRMHDRPAQMLTIFFAVSLITLIDVSRVVLSAHYFTDVIAGTLLGLFWLCAILMLPRPK